MCNLIDTVSKNVRAFALPIPRITEIILTVGEVANQRNTGFCQRVGIGNYPSYEYLCLRQGDVITTYQE